MEKPLLTCKLPSRFTLVLSFCFALCFWESTAHSYPEMIRYGYVNCSSCHVNLNGGGVLTDYGRELSKEELAIWKSSDEKSKEHLGAYGLLSETPLQKYLKIGGDARALYLYKNTKNFSSGRTYFMQGDVEAALVKDHWTVVAAAGVEEPVPATNPTLQFVSRRHYIQYSIDDHWNLRAGRFVPSYGINTADHVALTRSRLLLGYGLETYNLELSRISEQWSFFVTGTLGRNMDMENQTFHLDSAWSAQVSYAPTEKMKVGVNIWSGSNDQEIRRGLMGGYALLGLTERLVFESEVDFTFINPPNAVDTIHGFASTQKISYQLMEGIWPYLIQEYGKSNFLIDSSLSERYGIGFQIFPRTHFEFDLLYEQKRDGSASFYDYAYLLSHFYL